jgi:hypothetical protein
MKKSSFRNQVFPTNIVSRLKNLDIRNPDWVALDSRHLSSFAALKRGFAGFWNDGYKRVRGKVALVTAYTIG